MLQNPERTTLRQYQIIQPIQLFAEISAMTLALTCKTRHAPSREEHPERWPSGLRRTLGKRVCGKLYRGFESHSLRHPYSAPRFLHRWMGRKSPVNWGISIAATVLEIAELRHFSLGDGIFLRSFVLCGFSIVSKSEVPEGQLETKFAPGSNPGWMSERN